MASFCGPLPAHTWRTLVKLLNSPAFHAKAHLLAAFGRCPLGTMQPIGLVAQGLEVVAPHLPALVGHAGSRGSPRWGLRPM